MLDKMKILNRIKEVYLKDVNIIEYLTKMDDRKMNSIEDIMISYDFQAGTYSDHFRKNKKFHTLYSAALAKIIDELGGDSILEVGVGEGTTLGPVISSLQKIPSRVYGFDISWSRIKYAKKFLRDELNISTVELFTGDLFSSPLVDNAIDIVYTSHSIEPNGGREYEALRELYRIAGKYLVLLEPGYEFSTEEAKERMIRLGYVTNLYQAACELGYKIIEHRLFGIHSNDLNPTGLIIIEKKNDKTVRNALACPITKSKLLRKDDAFFSEESLLAYPIIGGIPCLLPQNAIVATKFMD